MARPDSRGNGSLGFRAYNSNGVPGFVTAAHLRNGSGGRLTPGNVMRTRPQNGTWRDIGVVYRAQLVGLDAAFVTTGSNSIVTNNVPNGVLDKMSGTLWPVTGSFVFSVGYGTNLSLRSGEILAVGVVTHAPGGNIMDSVRVQMQSNGGDSGGIVFGRPPGNPSFPLLVAGITVTGGQTIDGHRTHFSRADNILREFGLTLMNWWL